STHPVVMIDQGHHNHHTAGHGYRAFAELLKNDGYRVAPVSGRLDRAALAGTQVLVSVCATGADSTGADAAFTSEEIAAIGDWVESGGALLLVFDHYPFGDAVSSLAARFGIDLGRGSVEDSTHCDPAANSTGALVFERSSELLGDHAITQGRDPGE